MFLPIHFQSCLLQICCICERGYENKFPFLTDTAEGRIVKSSWLQSADACINHSDHSKIGSKGIILNVYIDVLRLSLQKISFFCEALYCSDIGLFTFLLLPKFTQLYSMIMLWFIETFHICCQILSMPLQQVCDNSFKRLNEHSPRFHTISTY